MRSALPLPLEPHLACRVAGGSYALPLAAIQEVLRLPLLQPGPGAGLLNLRGRAVPVLDLARALGLPPRTPDPGDVLVVLADGSLALWVEDLEDIVEPVPLPAPDTPAPCPLAPDLGAVGARVVRLLDLARLRRAVAAAAPAGPPGPADRDLLAARAEACLAPPAPAGARRPVLAFTLAGEPFALDLARVREIARCPALHPLPGAPPAYPGLAVHRGEPLLVLDPRPLLGLAPAPPAAAGGPGSRLLVVDEPAGRLGLFAEAVDGVLDLEPGDRVQSGLGPRPPEWREGEWAVAGRPLVLLRLDALLDQPVPFP